MNDLPIHNPNPFDFVPFADHPYLKTTADFDAMGKALSGYLEVKLQALTPVHVVGQQVLSDGGRQSSFYRQDGAACIPAASIRGCLRAFMEALTSGWMSQANLEYEKKRDERHIGFATFKPKQSQSANNPSIIYEMESAVNPEFEPKILPGPTLDVASYLFGIVHEKSPGEEAPHAALARKSRIWIEDAYLQKDDLDETRYWIPDLSGKPLMGGAKPSASSWWYMQPKQVQPRPVNKDGRKFVVAEFVGERYRGRKFYFHQDPERCAAYYAPKGPGNWTYRPKNPFCRVRLESLKPGCASEVFRIYLDRVPQALAILLALCLLPGKTIRHKLGYGKAYGFGSIEFSLQAARLRYDAPERRIPDALTDRLAEVSAWSKLAWVPERLQTAGFGVPAMIDWRALIGLAIVLGWEPAEKQLFTYPPFGRGITAEDFDARLQPNYTLGAGFGVNSKTARAIASGLFNDKASIHFRLYQDSAEGWEQIWNASPEEPA